MWKFLESKPEMFGIDISDSSVKFLKLAKTRNGFFSVQSVGEIDIEPGVIEAGEIKNQQALSSAIRKICNSAEGRKIKTKYVVASLPEEKSFLEVIQMPNMNQKELASAIIYEAENYVPLSIDQVYLDFQVIPSDDQNLEHLDVLIVAMPKATVDSYCLCLKNAGLVPCVLDIESNAIARALVKDGKSSSPLILVNFGKKNSNFAIFYGSSLRFTSSVSVSSSQITDAIAKALNVSLQEAEKIKLNYSLSDKDKDNESRKIYNAMFPVLNDLVMQIKKYFTFYKDHVSKEHIHQVSGENDQEKIILTGGGSSLRGLADFLSKETFIKTENGNIFSNIVFEKNDKNYVNKQITPSFCTAIGLAIRAVEKT